jgi:hypothetical protein
MKKNNLGWFIFVVCVVLWSLFEMYPPTSRDLIEQFTSRAENQDAAFTNILKQVEALQLTKTNSEFANLQTAIGTNDIQNYFPFINAKNQLQSDLLRPEPASARRGGQDQARPRFAGRHVVPRGDGHQRAFPRGGHEQRSTSRASRTSGRCRRRLKCCASAWTVSAWPNRSSNPPAATAF